MLMQVTPGSLRGCLCPPPDKSISHRALLFSALARGHSRISNLLRAEDVLATWRCLQAMGVRIEPVGTDVVVEGLAGRFQPASRPLYLGNSGTSLRLLTGLLAAQPGISTTLVGDRSLNRRPIGRVLRPLQLMGAEAYASPLGTAPVLLFGRQLRAIEYTLPVASAQLKSALLLAGLQAAGETIIHEPVPSRDHSERLLRRMGAQLEQTEGMVRVTGPGYLQAMDQRIPGDFSSAAPFITAATLVPGSCLLLSGVGLNPTRIGLLPVLERMGAAITVSGQTSVDGEPWGEISVEYNGELRATEVTAQEIPLLIDEVPLVVVAACLAAGTTWIHGVQELRVKESDRVDSILRPLLQLGATIEVVGDSLCISGQPGSLQGGVRLDAAGDHRIAMALAVAATAAREPVQITGAEWVDISYPGFFQQLQQLQEVAQCGF